MQQFAQIVLKGLLQPKEAALLLMTLDQVALEGLPLLNLLADWLSGKLCCLISICRMHAALKVLQKILQQTAVHREATISSHADGRGVTEDEQCAALKVLEVVFHTCPCNSLPGPRPSGRIHCFDDIVQNVAI